MACFIVPATEAIVTTVITKVAKKSKEKNPETKINDSIINKMKWLNNMLWGGSALLAFEHIWHGEVVPWFPFLTNAIDPANRAEMIHEMATTGVTMAVLVTAVWVLMVLFSYAVSKENTKELEE
ncbi:MAG: hypothetical protein ACI4VF_05415 [Lachnospirales bacterium]